MNPLGKALLDARNQQGIVLRQLAAHSGIDAALISKIERGKRLPTEEQLQILSKNLNLNFTALRRLYLAEKVYDIVKYETAAHDILIAAESRIEYLKSNKGLKQPKLSNSLQALLDEVDILRNKWNAGKPHNNLVLSKMRDYFGVEYTYESNKIEGNTLTLQETHLVVNEGITIAGKSLKEHLEAVNHYEAIDFIISLTQKKENLSPRSLLELHYLILKGIDKRNAGKYRDVGVKISGSKHVPPDALQIQQLMDDYFTFYESQINQIHPVILAAEMHERLVTIHPFVDGNGRTSRLVMNLILLNNGYTIANLKGDAASRIKYFQCLEKAQVDTKPESFHKLVANTVKLSLKAHLDWL